MSAEDPIDNLTDSVSEGRPVDWGHAESGVRTANDRASLRGLRDLEQIADYHRRLQRSGGAIANAPRSVSRPEQWGDLTLLELVSSGANGEVWRAWDAWLQREVALKFLQTWSGPAPGGASDSWIPGSNSTSRLPETRPVNSWRDSGRKTT